jgi:hypothetical protein
VCLGKFWPPCVTRESVKPIFQNNNNNADCANFFKFLPNELLRQRKLADFLGENIL